MTKRKKEKITRTTIDYNRHFTKEEQIDGSIYYYDDQGWVRSIISKEEYDAVVNPIKNAKYLIRQLNKS